MRNENDHLRAAYNIGGLHHYVYDHTGERLMKSTLWDVNISGNGSGGGPQYVLDPYIVYVGPHMVVRFYADTLEVTNHYYMGAQRIASRPYGATPDWFVASGTHGDDSGWEDPASPFGDPPIENNIVLDEILPIIEEFQLEWEFDPNETASNGLPSYSHQWFAPDWCEVEGEYYPNMSRVLQYWCDCIHESYRLENPEDCANHEEVYWYHPDYLGSTEYVTDLSGLPNEHYFYTPFGEDLVAEQAWYSDNSTPYLFNSKEVDPETGLHYYGARYYDSRVSMWMSVDPMASERSWLTPYNFVQDNPVMLWDPTGMLDGNPGGTEPPAVSSLGTAIIPGEWYNGGILMECGVGPGSTYGWTAESSEMGYNGTLSQYESQYPEFAGMSHSQAMGHWNSNYGESFRANWAAAVQREHDQAMLNKLSLFTGYFKALEDVNKVAPFSYGVSTVVAASTSARTVTFEARLATSARGATGSNSAIKGFTQHATNQAITRGFKTADILKIVNEGTPAQAMGRYGAQTRYTLGGNTVVLNAQGKVVTVYSNAPGTANGVGRGFFIPIK